ncbi:MAG: proline dehydrogenase family protein [Pseudomonadota bacterium]
MLRPILLRMSASEKWKRRISRWRMTRGTVARFIAGNTLDEAVESAKLQCGAGFLLTMDHLGEAVLDPHIADQARDEYEELILRIQREELCSTISCKPTQLGLAQDPAATEARILSLVRKAEETGSMVEIDMEDHPYTDLTLDIYEKARALTPRVRVCLQAYLHRTPEDLERLIGIGGNIRLVKGAYKEPPAVGLQRKQEVDQAFADLVERSLSAEATDRGFFVAVASHDESLIKHTASVAEARGLPKDAFEFQFLHGIRRERAAELVTDGYPVRLYFPYGSQWYPYFMRRLAERPANLMFMMKNMF